VVRRDSSRNEKKNSGKNENKNRNKNDYKKQNPLKERYKENPKDKQNGNSKVNPKEAKGETISYGLSADDWSIPVFASVETDAQLKAVMDIKAVSRIYVDEACFGIPGKTFDKKGAGSMGHDTHVPKKNDEKPRVTEAEAFAEIFKSIRASGKECGLRLRRIERETDPCLNSRELLEKLIELDAAPDAVLIRSFDEAMILSEEEHSESGNKGLNTIKKIFDYTCYGYNTEAVSMLMDLGAQCLTYPIELTGRECMGLKKALRENESDVRIRTVPYEQVVYGHLPMMVSANCLRKTSAGCDHKNRFMVLRDRMQKDMPVRCYCKYCYNQIFNAEPLVLYDLPEDVRSLEPECLRYDFSVETGSEIRKILAGAIPKDITRGHFRHGVE
jgi:putative protease